MIRTGTIAFLGGVLLLQQLPALPTIWLLILAPVLLYLLIRKESSWLRLLACFILGFIWASGQANWLLDNQLSDDLIGRDIQLTGYIASLPVQGQRAVRFEFDVEQVMKSPLAAFPDRIRLSWYKKELPALAVGQRWRFTVRVKPPRNFFNPGSFEYAGWLLQKRILATGYIRDRAENRLLSDQAFVYPVQRLRQAIRNKLLQHLAHHPLEPVIRGLVIGDRSDMQSDDWSVLRNTGTVHLLAISGLHIGLIAGLAFVVFRMLWSRCSYCCLYLSAPRAAAIFAWLIAVGYAGLAGFAIPTQRAVLMLTVVFGATVLQRQTRPSNVLAIALLLILLLDPFAVLAAGFWLSFFAVVLIYYLLMSLAQNQSRWYRWMRMQGFISIGLLPVVVLFFQQAPILSPLTNLIAVPWISLVIVPAALFSVLMMFIHPGAGRWCLELTTDALGWLWQVLELFSRLDMNVVYMPAPGLFSLILAVAGLLVLFLPRGLPIRGLGLFLCLPLVFVTPSAPAKGELRLTLLDVGQGLSAVIQTHRHVMVFDTGPKYSAHFDTGQAVVVPYLRSFGVNKIDQMIISHGDNDHIGGANSLLRELEVKRLHTSVPARFADQTAERCLAGQHWVWDGVTFEVLYPRDVDYESGMAENDLSCVVQVRTADHQVLLTGDIEASAEAFLLERYGEKLRSSVLVIPHHGSRTSSTEAFVSTVRPAIALLPAGWRNRFRLPNRQVVERYHLAGANIYSSAEHGAVSLTLGSEVSIQAHRQKARRYWHYQESVIGTSRYAGSLLKLAAD